MLTLKKTVSVHAFENLAKSFCSQAINFLSLPFKGINNKSNNKMKISAGERNYYLAQLSTLKTLKTNFFEKAIGLSYSETAVLNQKIMLLQQELIVYLQMYADKRQPEKIAYKVAKVMEKHAREFLCRQQKLKKYRLFSESDFNNFCKLIDNFSFLLKVIDDVNSEEIFHKKAVVQMLSYAQKAQQNIQNVLIKRKLASLIAKLDITQKKLKEYEEDRKIVKFYQTQHELLNVSDGIKNSAKKIEEVKNFLSEINHGIALMKEKGNEVCVDSLEKLKAIFTAEINEILYCEE